MGGAGGGRNETGEKLVTCINLPIDTIVLKVGMTVTGGVLRDDNFEGELAVSKFGPVQRLRF